ncbi:hypothetical protein [Hymenobacter nivis]|uniref:Uncharacterized protein n=1 Tax=Hymenobacter nivis TaxID=1850093 RepID=A0A2Z3GVE5_9BACT|nr:hypothetical protein [Hymenobacter nivis]AWM35416.1 hypothetical protein DDQ68_13225 [Hymenobacter nivis]
MPTLNDQAEQHIGGTKGLHNHVHDLIHDPSTRLDALWRYDQCIANAEKGEADNSKQFWQILKAQEIKNVDGLKELIRKRVQNKSL